MSRRTDTAGGAGAWDAMLLAVLVPNRAARVVREEAGGGLTIAVPTRKPSFMRGLVSWLVRVPKERLTVLDPIGAGLWRECDGRKTVEEIVVAFGRRHRLSFHESRVSVTGYIQSLLRRGLLAVAVGKSRA